MKFKYTRIEDDSIPGGFAYLPLIDINLGPNKLPVKCLIDSGSSITVIHSPLAVAAGIIPATGEPSSIFGISGGAISGYYQIATADIYGNEWELPIFFTTELKIPYALLGQINFFQKFKLIFDLAQREFEIKPNHP